MNVAHLSDLHLRDDDDAVAFGQQLDGIVARGVDHLVITGDLLDRWQPTLLTRALDCLDERGLLHRDRLTIIHGNHDLASSGGHPRARADVWRLVVRFWDPPPLLRARRRRFYAEIERRAPGVAAPPPFLKEVRGVSIAALDSNPAPWRPFAIGARTIALHHAEGAIDRRQTDWLAVQRRGAPFLLLVHHYPLPVPPYSWHVGTGMNVRHPWLVRMADRNVVVNMEIRTADRDRLWHAARAAGVTAILCGHVHRTRLEWQDGIAVGLNGQSGASWAGRTIAYYAIDGRDVAMEQVPLAAALATG